MPNETSRLQASARRCTQAQQDLSTCVWFWDLIEAKPLKAEEIIFRAKTQGGDYQLGPVKKLMFDKTSGSFQGSNLPCHTQVQSHHNLAQGGPENLIRETEALVPKRHQVVDSANMGTSEREVQQIADLIQKVAPQNPHAIHEPTEPTQAQVNVGNEKSYMECWASDGQMYHSRTWR